ncbi:hypothetical protein MMA231_02761 [Asticcacaulis sp. MM231]|uniref:SPOR domain-containing protein n=1 Tax=Asticcacaulis sp. MM231 TaxID=3157666 RepID=UPI0032D58F42
MTDPSPIRKAFILCAAVVSAAALTACDSQNLKESLARIKAVPVDASGQPSDHAEAKSLNREDVELVVKTAKDLTVGEEGLLRDAKGPLVNPKITIAIVDPLKIPPAVNAPLETGITATPPAVVAASSAGRLIQIGSFASADAAQNAWKGLQARYPGIEQYRPTYQSITTAAGKPMVRLRVGPVTDDNQAQSLCRQLDIRDAWCAKAG